MNLPSFIIYLLLPHFSCTYFSYFFVDDLEFWGSFASLTSDGYSVGNLLEVCIAPIKSKQVVSGTLQGGMGIVGGMVGGLCEFPATKQNQQPLSSSSGIPMWLYIVHHVSLLHFLQSSINNDVKYTI